MLTNYKAPRSPPSGSSLPRSMACSRPLQRDSSRSRAYHRPHVSISAGFPRGVGCLGNPPTLSYPVDTCAPARLSSCWVLPPCHGQGGRAVMTGPACARERDTGLRRSVAPCAAARRTPRFAGFLGSVAESPADTLSPYPCLLAVANHPRRLPHPHDDSTLGSTKAYPSSAGLAGIPSRIPGYHLLFPLLGLRVSRYPREYAVSPTPGRQELHLHGDPGIKDPWIFAP